MTRVEINPGMAEDVEKSATKGYKNNKEGKTVSILSSKGGVGKTTICVSLIDFLAQKSFRITAVDADVNAPNLAKWFDNISDWDKEGDIKIFPLPNVYKKCRDIKILCDGTELSVELEKRGDVYVKEKYTPSFANYSINLISGDIMKGKTGSGKVVEGVIKTSDDFDYDFRVMDSAPGTGYPVLSCIISSDYAVLVTEATSLGFKDLKKLIGIVEKKGVPYGVVTNMDTDPEIANQIRSYVGENYVSSLPYDETIPLALKKSLPPTRLKGPSSKKLNEICEKIFSKIR